MRRYDLEDATREPLTQDERACLVEIYYRRRWLFTVVFLAMTVLAWLITGPLKRPHGEMQREYQRGYYGEKVEVDFAPLTVNQSYLLIKAGMLLMIWIPGAIVYAKRVGPFMRDARGGEKAAVYHTVTGKRSFEHVSQFYLLLDNPDCMHQEVDAKTYNRVQPGDRWPMYFAPRSGYAFNPRGRFSLM